MIGIDGNFALLQMVRAHLLRQTEPTPDKDNLSAEEKAYLASGAYGYNYQYAFAGQYVN